LHTSISIFAYCPFILLLLFIAVLPVITPRFWEKNRNKAIITAVLSVPVAWYLLTHNPHELLSTMEEYI
jgi:hypothetical protein